MKHHSGRFYVDLAQKNHLEMTNGKGDHVKVYGEVEGHRTMMPIPLHRELATGTECTIKKWFMRLGILFFLGSCLAMAYIASIGTVGGFQ